MMQPAIFHNPVNGETTTILKSALDTAGEYTLFEVTLAPGGGNPVHYHTKFTEEFFAVKGRLGLQNGTATIYLNPGESLLVPVRVHHRFFNDTAQPVTFRVKLVSGQPDFENFLKAMFGLVNDGRVFGKTQVPVNIYYAAVALKWGDTYLASPWFKLALPVINLLYRRAVKKGADKKLLQLYCNK